MPGCIYIRTFSGDDPSKRLVEARQLDRTRALAERHAIQVADHYVFTDFDCAGHCPPINWAAENEESRPALAAMLDAIEAGQIRNVLVARVERLATDSSLLTGLSAFFRQHGVSVVSEANENLVREDPSEAFARSLMQPCLQLDTEAEAERKQRLRERKVEEITRLRKRIARLEDEVAGLGPEGMP